jgi:hypothetical protein
LGEKKIRLSRTVAVAAKRKIYATPTGKTKRHKELKFWLSDHLGQLDVLHTQNFEIQIPMGSRFREVF